MGRQRRPMKKFTPPPGYEGESSEYSDDDDYSEYSDSDSYTSSSYTDSDSSSDEDEDATLKAMRAAARAKALRSKFEQWEQTQDAKDQARQMMLTDENGECIETASNLKAKFEALRLLEEAENK